VSFGLLPNGAAKDWILSPSSRLRVIVVLKQARPRTVFADANANEFYTWRASLRETCKFFVFQTGPCMQKDFTKLTTMLLHVGFDCAV